MKGFVLACTCLCFTLLAIGQNKNDHQICGATYFDSIPLYIESNLYADKLYPGQEFMVVPSKLKVSLAQRMTTICGNTFFRLVKKCINKSRFDQIEYCLTFADQAKENQIWRKLPTTSLLTDTVLEQNEKISLQFRQKSNHKIIQQTIIHRADWTPVINGYRQRNLSDSFDNTLKSNAAYKTRERLPGFERMNDSSITIQAGKQVELQFDSRDISIDSCIEYRVRDVKENQISNWQYTGYVLSLRNIAAKHDYVLETKYRGEKAIKKYRIHALPYWYQQFWAMVLFIVIGISLLTGIPYLLYQGKKRKIQEEENKIKQQLKANQTKLNPHFVFNAICTIDGLVNNNEIEKASESLHSFSDIMRRTLKNSDYLFISLTEEEDILKKYIDLERLRFDFNFELNIDPAINTNIDFPPMLIQPSIENAVKHGVAGLGQEGLINIDFIKIENDLLVTIKDNGHLNKSKFENQGNGKGVALTKERIEQLNRLFPKDKIRYSLELKDHVSVASFIFENWLT